MNESQIQNQVLRFCKTNGIIAHKLDSSTSKGWPDLTLILKNGCVLFLEIKTEKGILSKMQKRIHRKLRDNNALVFVIRSLPEAMRVISTYG